MASSEGPTSHLKTMTRVMVRGPPTLLYLRRDEVALHAMTALWHPAASD